MPARVRTHVICSALLGALAIACGAPPITVVVPSAPRDAGQQVPGQQQAGGQQQVPDQSPAEQQQPEGQAAGAQQPPAASRPGPASQASGGLAAGPESGSHSQQPIGGQFRPKGDAPGVGHPIPTVGTDLADKDDTWVPAANDCIKAVGKPNCLTVLYNVYKQDQQGKLAKIPDPGPDYGSQYPNGCKVANINPPAPKDGGPKYVPAYSTITIKIVCIANETDGSSGSSEEQNNHKNPTGASDQSNNKKGKTGAENGP